MNDVARQVAAALGTAVVGSLIASLYASRVSDSAETLPDGLRTAAEDSIGGANAVAAGLPSGRGAGLTDAAAAAYTDALGIGFTVAGGFALLAAVIVKVWLPARHITREGEATRTPALVTTSA